jgi:hypothetical protein
VRSPEELLVKTRKETITMGYIHSHEVRRSLETSPNASSSDDTRGDILRLEAQQRIEMPSNDAKEKFLDLTDLPKDLWWQVYIDAPFHEDAMKKSNPGRLFDDQRSPGYQRSMIEALDTFVVNKELQQKDIDYDLYTKIHQCATSYIFHKEIGSDQREWMSRPNGISSDSPYPFTFARLNPIPEEGVARQERLAALEEMRHENINGVPLYTDHPDYDAEKQQWLREMNKHQTYDFLEYICDHGFMNLKNHAPDMNEMLQELNIKDKPQGIIMGITSTHDRSVAMLPLYSPGQGPEIISACFREYNDSMKRPDQSRDQILRDIARLVRQVHMVHQKYDGMGRTNTCILLNKELVRRGFCPTILPEGPGVFGGLKTLDGLVKDIRDGMRKFQEAVETSKVRPQEGSVLEVNKLQESSYEALDHQIRKVNTIEGKQSFEHHTLTCLQTENKKQWLEGTINKLAMIYHGMDIINRYQHNEQFKDLFMENSEEFFRDSPPDERFKIDKQDSAGKVFMERYGIDFLKSDLGKEWFKRDDGKQWLESYSGKIFVKRHKEDFSELALPSI